LIVTALVALNEGSSTISSPGIERSFSTLLAPHCSCQGLMIFSYANTRIANAIAVMMIVTVGISHFLGI